MLAENKMKVLNEWVQQHTREELVWISGYLAGLARQNGALLAVADVAIANGNANAAPKAVKALTLLYGTETGNAKRAASATAAKLKQQGFRLKLASLDQYKITDLPKENNLLVIISTQGDGDPPAAAQKFYDHLHTGELKLTDTRFSVLALGSTAYPQFCKTGIDVDTQLEKLGAKRLLPVVKCDEDFDDDAENWLTTVLKKITEEAETAAEPAAPVVVAKPAEKGKKYFGGIVTTNIDLMDEGSMKATHHIEITLDEAVEYKPGDAAGLVPENQESQVQQIMELSGLAPDTEILYKSVAYSLYEILKKKLNILHLPERTVKKYAQLVQQEIPDTRMDFFDLLRIYPVQDAEQFVQAVVLLDAIAPRLYSISSSPEAHSGEMHLTVARDEFMKNNEKAVGLCSQYLLEYPVDTPIQLFLHRQKHFHLPQEDKDLIMIGPGTGIAPLRSFIAERDALGASGRNWLFFGEQHFNTDFLYQTEIQGWKETGVLTKVSLAFSRDQKEKIYVQDRLRESATELWEWINNGAYMVVCGKKNPMSKDVEQALIEIIAEQNNLTIEAATGYLNQLGKDGRYSKDVW